MQCWIVCEPCEPCEDLCGRPTGRVFIDQEKAEAFIVEKNRSLSKLSQLYLVEGELVQ